MIQIFPLKQLKEALAFAMEGGQAIHLMPESYAHLRPDTPNCFKSRGDIAHLFDQNRDRVVATAKRMGVKIIKIEREGTPRQHIDLCGRPLARLMELAKQEAWEKEHGLTISS